MRINRRKVMGLVAAAVTQASQAAPQASTPRTADDELQVARQQRLSDAQRIAMVKLPPTTEPAFRFRA